MVYLGWKPSQSKLHSDIKSQWILNPLTSIPIETASINKTPPLFPVFLLNTSALYQSALHKNKRQGLQSDIIYPEFEVVGMNERIVKFFPVTLNSINISHLLLLHPFSSVNPSWNLAFSSRTPIGNGCLRKKRQIKLKSEINLCIHWFCYKRRWTVVFKLVLAVIQALPSAHYAYKTTWRKLHKSRYQKSIEKLGEQ